MRILTVISAAVIGACNRVFDAPAASARNAAEYGEELAWLGGDMDGIDQVEHEAPLLVTRRDRVRGSALLGGLHSQSSTDPEARNHVR